MTFYIYMLLCEDGSFYTGYTVNVERRYALHMKGHGARYTRMRKPQKIVYVEPSPSRIEAIRRERVIKGFSHQQKAILCREWEDMEQNSS